MLYKNNCYIFKSLKPSPAFLGSSWVAFATGVLGYLIGLYRSDMKLDEKGYYFSVLMFGLFAAVSLQKTVRDKLEKIPVTDLYYRICWFSTIVAISLLVIGLFNSTSILPSDKGFYALSFLLGLFGAVTIQKNTRDILAADKESQSSAS